MTGKNRPPFSLEGKAAVVTGSNRGIGKCIAETLAVAGAKVLGCARTQDEAFLAWSEEFGVVPVNIDLADEASIQRAIIAIRKCVGQVDVLVNCAGIGHGGLFQMTSIADIRKVFEVNLFGQIALTQGISRLMMRARKGAIINISSSAARLVDPGTMTYGASKAALERATESMAQELGAMGIRVNAIAPGVVTTDMANQMDEKARQALIDRSVLAREAEPHDIANMALFLASDMSAHVTGQIINVDGGALNKR